MSLPCIVALISKLCTWYRNKPGHPHSLFHGITLWINPHCSPQMESMSLTTSGQGLLEPLEGASADEHWRSKTAVMV